MRRKLANRLIFSVALLAFTAVGVLLPIRGNAVTTRFSSFDLWPSVSDRYYFSMSSSEGLYRFQYEFRLANMYVLRPLDIVNAAGVRQGSVIDYFFGHYLSGAFAVTDYLQFGFTLPFFSVARFTNPNVTPTPAAVTRSKIGDIRLSGKVRILDANRYRFGVAVEPFVMIPLGGDDTYLGDTKFGGGANVIGDFLITDKIRATLNVGTDFKGDRVAVNNIGFQHRLLTAVGLSADIFKGLNVSGESHFNTAFSQPFQDPDTSPVEFLGKAQYAIGQTGFTVDGGFGSCGVCGAKGAKFRAFLGVAYQRQNAEMRAKAAKEADDRAALVGVKSERERLTEQIMSLKDRCPGDAKDFDPKVHDAACPKYFELKAQAVSLGGLEDSQFATVVLTLRQNCPDDPAAFNPEIHDAGCSKFFELREQVISLGDAVSLKGTDSEKFAEVVLSLKKNCPANPAEFNPEVHDAGCPKYYQIRERAVKIAKAEDKERFALLKDIQGQDEDEDGIPDAFDNCPSNPEDKNNIADEDGCPEYGVTISENEISTLAPVNFEFNKTNIHKGAAEILRHVSEALFFMPGVQTVEVVGYADSIGTPEGNRHISLARANKVVAHLKLIGVPEGMTLIPIGRGAENPIAPNTTERGRFQNRRVTFRRVAPSEPMTPMTLTEESAPKAKKEKKHKKEEKEEPIPQPEATPEATPPETIPEGPDEATSTPEKKIKVKMKTEKRKEMPPPETQTESPSEPAPETVPETSPVN